MISIDLQQSVGGIVVVGGITVVSALPVVVVSEIEFSFNELKKSALQIVVISTIIFSYQLLWLRWLQLW